MTVVYGKSFFQERFSVYHGFPRCDSVTYLVVLFNKYALAHFLHCLRREPIEGFAQPKGKRMDTDNRFLRDPAERLKALLLAAAATFLVFAAINAGFTPQVVSLAGRIVSLQPGLGL